MIRGFSFNATSLRESLHTATSGILTLPSTAPSVLSKYGRQASVYFTVLCRRSCCILHEGNAQLLLGERALLSCNY